MGTSTVAIERIQTRRMSEVRGHGESSLPGDGKEVQDRLLDSPFWWSRGNGFDLLHSDPPPNLGVKQNNRTVGPDVFGRLRSRIRDVVFTPRVENVGGLPLWADGRTLKRMNRGSQRGQHSFEMYG